MTKPRREKILVVDDDRDMVELLTLTLTQEGYSCESAQSGQEALLHLNKNGDKPFALVLTDLLMPLMDGIELMENIQETHPEIGVLVISADTNLTLAVEAMRKGALDFITKPFRNELILPRIQKALERVHLELENREYQLYLEEKVENRTAALLSKHRSLQKLYFNTVEAIVRAIEAKDPYTVGHSKRVSKYCTRIAEKMKLGEADVQDVMIAGLLHDVGKIGISDAVLTKTSRLSIEEYELIKEHPLISLKIIEPIHELKKAKEYVKYHHEKWDGTGYPDGLKGEAIPLGARILSVADAFDTMWIGRHYHEAWDMDTVIGEFRKNSGTQFDKTVVDAFNHLIVDERAAFDRIREDNPPQFSVAPPFKNPLKI
ncbi:MAG: hypothetical protein A3A86_05730 [Elusimicrobia bacterium RIFCSPLOWO2_01_FULL_60_11]|nr:MAG: hypothetical protein A3A86_05730 [Elusimicrobia bacterium RIFCSPLOWO2_01_FULL_60_11]